MVIYSNATLGSEWSCREGSIRKIDIEECKFSCGNTCIETHLPTYSREFTCFQENGSCKLLLRVASRRTSIKRFCSIIKRNRAAIKSFKSSEIIILISPVLTIICSSINFVCSQCTIRRCSHILSNSCCLTSAKSSSNVLWISK